MHNSHPDPLKLSLARDLLHKLGQPITALHCSLEIALRKQLGVAESRLALEQALSLTSTLLQITNSERNIIEARGPGNPALIDLAELLRTELPDLQAVLGETGSRLFAVLTPSVVIDADPTKIRHLLFVAFNQIVGNKTNQHDLLILLIKECGKAVLYAGPTFSPLEGPTSFSVTTLPIVSIQLAANLASAAHGHLDILETSSTVKLLLTFPLLNAPPNVSTNASET